MRRFLLIFLVLIMVTVGLSSCQSIIESDTFYNVLHNYAQKGVEYTEKNVFHEYIITADFDTMSRLSNLKAD